jgi:spermidine synthase
VKLLLAILLAAACGFISLSYELLWFRVYFIAKGALASGFAILLGAYLLALALGSLWSHRLCKEDQRDSSKYLRLIADVLAGAYLVAFISVPAFGWYCSVQYQQSRLPWLALPAALIGAAFPLMVHFSVPPDRRAGARLSYLYLANIVGSASGSLLTGFWLMNIWSIQQISVFVLGLGVAISAILYASCRLSPSALWVRLSLLLGVGAAGSLAAPRLFDGIYERIQLGTKYQPSYRFAEVLENRNGVITITPDKTIYCSGTYDGAINVNPKKPDKNQIIRAYAVSALHPNPQDALMIGLSMGAWAQVLANHPQVRRLTIVEINPGYLRLIPKFPEVASLLKNPKVEIFIDDGRRWLARNPERHFDLIVFNIGAHWIASSAHVLSQEFQELARAHLAPGGVYYFNTTGSARAQRTAALVFKDARRILQWIAASDSPIQFDVERLQRTLWEYRIDGQPVVSEAASEDRAEVERIVLELERQHESKDRILLRTSKFALITDDNMGYEWDDAI